MLLPPRQKNIQKKILVSVCFMLHSTILKQQQKDKTNYTEGDHCDHKERKARKVSLGLYKFH